jgi:polysaccharide biosynthesis protein PslA
MNAGGAVRTDEARVSEPVTLVGVPGESATVDASSSASSIADTPLHSVFEFTIAPLFTRNRRAHRALFYAALVATDLLCIFSAFALGSIVRTGDLGGPNWVRVALAAIPIFVLCAVHNGAYSLDALRSAVVGVKRAIAALLSSFAILFVISYFLKAGQEVSRLGIGVGLTAATFGMLVARNYLSTSIRRRFGDDLTSTLLITDESFVTANSSAVVVDALKLGIRPEPRNPLMVQRLVQLLSGADRVIVACRREVCTGWAAMLKTANVCGEILADEVQTVGAVALGRFGERTTLVVAPGPLSLQQRVIKRVFDLCIAVPILLFVAPVLVAVAIAIKIDSPGPVFFRQRRVGFGNRFFDMYKFRSMAFAAADPLGTNSTARDDARITCVGKFIRRTSLDELPQLFNVVGGSMSMVGPRPHAIGSYAGPLLFWHVDDRYAHRHLLKPGITGLAQIRGYRGATNEIDDLSRRLQSDLEYMSGWSISRDLRILLKTIGVLTHPNAY